MTLTPSSLPRFLRSIACWTSGALGLYLLLPWLTAQAQAWAHHSVGQGRACGLGLVN